ncbi:hypothetical protein ABKN59_005260 [Abortiporus biennis]
MECLEVKPCTGNRYTSEITGLVSTKRAQSWSSAKEQFSYVATYHEHRSTIVMHFFLFPSSHTLIFFTSRQTVLWFGILIQDFPNSFSPQLYERNIACQIMTFVSTTRSRRSYTLLGLGNFH